MNTFERVLKTLKRYEYGSKVKTDHDKIIIDSDWITTEISFKYTVKINQVKKDFEKEVSKQ